MLPITLECMVNEFNGKKLALLLCSPDGESAVFKGKVSVENRKLYFTRGAKVKFLIPTDVCENIKKVDPELKDIFLGAEYYCKINVENIPSDETIENHLDTGLKWPTK